VSAQLREVVICEPVRTPIGRFGGMFKDVSPAQLASTAIAALMARTGIPGDRIDDVILGQAYPTAEAPPIGRVAALDAGLPVTVGGLQLDRRCGSGLQAILDGAMQVQTGISDVVIAGGVEVMSQAPFYTVNSRFGIAGTAGIRLHDALGRGRETAGGRYYPVPDGMLETAENQRRDYSISRADQDELAVRSQQRAGAAVADGRFGDEIVPVTVKGRKGDLVLDKDETPRRRHDRRGACGAEARVDWQGPRVDRDGGQRQPGRTMRLRSRSSPPPSVPRSSASRPSCGWSPGRAPASSRRAWVSVPVPAVAKAFERSGLAMSDMDLIEVNEAFAAQVLAVTRQWKLSGL
jgi:acetyl-CoA acetyltransferase